MRRSAVVFVTLVLLAGLLLAQGFGDKPPVEMAPVGSVQVKAGGSKNVSLDFRIGSEFHINSHTPKSPLLIPTVLKLSGPEQVTVADVKYPAGQDMSFPILARREAERLQRRLHGRGGVEDRCQCSCWKLSRERYAALSGVRSQRLLSSEKYSGAVPGDGGEVGRFPSPHG